MKRFFLLFAAALLVSSCKFDMADMFYKGNSVLNRADSLKNLGTVTVSADEFDFLVISDVHTGISNTAHSQEVLLAWLEAQKNAGTLPEFCLALGDLADLGEKSQYEAYKEFTDKIEAYGVPVFNAVGNHDLYSDGWDCWQQFCYPGTSFYTFVAGGFSFYALDTGTGNLGNTQLSLLQNALQSDSRPKIIFTHYPLHATFPVFKMDDTTERNTLISLYAQTNVKLTLSGHHHFYEPTDFGSYMAYTVDSFGYQNFFSIVHVNSSAQTAGLTVVE